MKNHPEGGNKNNLGTRLKNQQRRLELHDPTYTLNSLFSWKYKKNIVEMEFNLGILSSK